MSEEVITNSFTETQELGEKMAVDLKGGFFIALFGDLGSGKTTFVQGLAKGLGIKRRIISPSFILVRRYKLPNLKFFYHVDLYRMESANDIKSLGLEEILNNSQNIVAIEWAEKLNDLPEKRIDMYFEYLEGDKQSLRSDELKRKVIWSKKF